MVMKVLLTGATGFVGRQVLRALAEEGCKVRAVVREQNQYKLGCSNLAGEVVTTADLFAENFEWWKRVCQGVDVIIHVAWYAEPGKYLQSLRNLDCLLGTLNLAKGAAAAGVKRFVGVGTCVEYDLTGGLLSIQTPLQPLTPYAGAKAAAYMALSQWFGQQKIGFAWCRLFYLFGEGEDGRRLVPYLRAKLAAGEPAELTEGSQIRDFLDVRVAGHMIVETAMGDVQGAVNICSGVPLTVRQLAEQIADKYGRRDLLKFGARPENITDPPCILGVR